MFAPRRSSRHARTLLLLALCAALIGTIPASPASAAVEYALPVDDVTAEFGDVGSTFLLSSLVEQTGEPASPTNRLGGVQLAPVGTLDFVDGANPLPTNRADIRATTIGKYIFAVGGSDGTNFVDTVYRGVVDQANGQIAWTTEAQSLPSVQHSVASGYTAQSAQRGAVAIASLTTDAVNGSGYIYVIGGAVQIGINTVSSRSILKGTVVNGDLTAWAQVGDGESTIAGVDGMLPRSYADDLGVSNTLPRGVDGASAFIATAGATTYLYVVGGRQRGPNTSGSQFNISQTRRIIYASVNTSTGDITWISNGTAGTYFDIPQKSGESGFWNGALVSGPLAAADGSVKTTFFLTGGQTSNTPDFTSRVVKGFVNANGTITFDGSTNAGAVPGTGVDGSLLDQRNGHGAVLWDNSVYIFGGRPSTSAPNDPNLSSSSPIVESPTRGPRVLSEFFGGGNFQELNDDTPADLPARYGGGYVVVPSTRSGVAYVYYIGGTSGAAASASVSRATIGDPPATPNYPSDGYYLSAPYSIALGGSAVKVKNIKWLTKDIAGGADIEVAYRLSTDTDCSALRTSTASWAEVDGSTGAERSLNGQNEALLDTSEANCFQYRVRLVRGTDAATTPSLLRLSIVVERPGSADLKFSGPQVRGLTNISGELQGLEITIINQNLFEQPTISADYGDGGSFTLDLFIYPPGVTPGTITLPYVNDFPSTDGQLQYLRATMQINRSLMGPNKTYVVNASDARWQYTNSSGTVVSGALALAQLFPTLGTYNLVAVVDGPDCGSPLTVGCVRETAVGNANPNAAEENNISATAQVVLSKEVGPTTYEVYLPVAGRNIQ